MEKVVLSLMFVHQLDMHAFRKTREVYCFSELGMKFELLTFQIASILFFITYKIMHTFNPSIQKRQKQAGLKISTSYLYNYIVDHVGCCYRLLITDSR